MLLKALSFYIFAFAHAALISTNAGRVGDEIITSREVMIYHKIEQALYGSTNSHSTLKLEKVKDPAFVRETTAMLLETAIYFEAESFSAVETPTSLIESQTQKVQKLLKRDALWKKLEVTTEELKKALRVKARAKDFIKFKVDSATIPITDKEAEDYFNSNRLKFENLPYENFKANIKSFLTKQQVDKRLKDWFELLNSKYRVRNFLAE